MKKTEIFQTVKKILACDAAFCREKFSREKDGSAIHAALPITEEMTDEAFVFAVNSYLCGFCVPGHLRFFKTQGVFGAGIRTERFGETLLVTAAEPGSGFYAGDRIVALDGLSVGSAAEKCKEFLYRSPEERQGMFFEDLLCYFSRARIMRICDGKETILEISIRKDLRLSRGEKYAFRILSGGAAYLRLDDFENVEAVKKLLAENGGAIKSHEFLIIDIRENGGGSDEAFLPLLSLCIAENETPDFAPDEIEINYSARNVDLRLETLEEYAAAASGESKTRFDCAVAALKEKRGKGFIREKFDPPPGISGTAVPKRVFVLIGPRCASSGEEFALAVKGLKKTTLVGRATMGILRYSNCAAARLDDFTLVYPTSVAAGACGAEPDVLIPRSEDPSRDPELEWVLKEIGKNQSGK